MEQNEHDDGDRIHTGGGAAVSGNAGAGRDFVGRDIFNQYFPPHPETPKPGELMADAANELWKAIAELNQIMGGLTSNVAANTRATEKQSQSIHEQAQSIQELARMTEGLSLATKEQGDRNEAQFRDFRAQISTLQRVAIALRPLGIQVPDMPEGQVSPISVRQSPWWQPYATPLLLAAILIVLILSLGISGGGP